jgi:hypothetical protein
LIDDSIGSINVTNPNRDNRYNEEESSNTTIIINSGKSTVTEQASKTTKFDLRQANIGAIATDEAQATVTGNTFNQNYNADTIELIKLVTTLRQTATQFPAEIQEGAIIDIEDLETEIQKPADQRSIPRLKRSLIALFAIAGTIAAPIAGMTDFTNNVLEIGNKLHIEFPKLP